MVLKPDLSTYTLLPWRSGEYAEARFVCDVYKASGRPFEGDPRYVLRQAMEDAAKDGYVFNTGPELEFFLFRMHEGRPTTQFQDVGGYFDLAPTDLAEDVRREIILALTEMGSISRPPITRSRRVSTRSTSSTATPSTPRTTSSRSSSWQRRWR